MDHRRGLLKRGDSLPQQFPLPVHVLALALIHLPLVFLFHFAYLLLVFSNFNTLFLHNILDFLEDFLQPLCVLIFYSQEKLLALQNRKLTFFDRLHNRGRGYL